jgi:hypothetical protein
MTMISVVVFIFTSPQEVGKKEDGTNCIRPSSAAEIFR